MPLHQYCFANTQLRKRSAWISPTNSLERVSPFQHLYINRLLFPHRHSILRREGGSRPIIHKYPWLHYFNNNINAVTGVREKEFCRVKIKVKNVTLISSFCISVFCLFLSPVLHPGNTYPHPGGSTKKARKRSEYKGYIRKIEILRRGGCCWLMGRLFWNSSERPLASRGVFLQSPEQ